MNPVRILVLPLLLLGVAVGSLAAQGTGSPTRVNVMPGYPNAPKLMPEERRPVRPGGPVCIWGNANGGLGTTDPSATYTWAFSPNQNLQILTDGDLGGTVADDRFICEVVTFNLLNNSPRETVTATLTVDGGASGVAAKTVQLDVVATETDPLQALRTDVIIAIEEGLLHLYRNATIVQPGAGTTDPVTVRWDSSWNVGSTAFALWALQNQGHLPVTANYDGDIYAEWVQMGLDWLFLNLTTESGADLNAPRADVVRGATADTVSDMNANDRSVRLDAGNRRGYTHPIATAAIVASGQPDRVVTVGPAIGSTYRTVVEDAIDWLGAHQNQGGNTLAAWAGRGGWRYEPTSTMTASDMSINSWAYVAMEGAESVFGIGIPDWLKQECEWGLVVHQNANGAFGYLNASYNGYGIATTGGGLAGLTLIETMGSFVPPGATAQPVGAVIATDPDVAMDTLQEKRDLALGWLGQQWHREQSINSVPWTSYNRGNYYSMWTVARAMRLTQAAQGLPAGQNLVLTNGGVDFDWETGEELATGNLPGAGDPREGYFPWLVRTQNLATPTATDITRGRWTGYLGSNLSTALSVLVLTPRVFVEPCPPIINIPVVQLSPAANTVLPPGTQVVLSGRAVAQGAERPIVGIFVNDQPVDGLDAGGNFFKTVIIGSGVNTFTIKVVDTCGQSEALHLVQGGLSGMNVSGLSDVSIRSAIEYMNTTFNLETSQLVVTARVRNIGTDVIDAPLLMVFESFTQPSVGLSNPDSIDGNGKPYVVFTDASTQPRLLPGQASAPKTLIFDNPNHVPVVFDRRFMAVTNQPPFFVSTPPVFAAAGQPYAYDAMAYDPNGDALTFSLDLAPVGMTVDPASGQVTWAPQSADVGAHAVVLRAVDGRGGFGIQSYQLDVSPSLPNGPPAFTSVPPTQAAVGSAYSYQAQAFDPNGDPLTFALASGPAGLGVDPGGLVSWGFVPPGTHPVSVRVSDPSGAFADQSWVIAAGVPSGNPHAPIIFGSPAAIAVANQAYLYQPVATDPDPGQTLTWTLVAGPTGLAIDPASGLVTWTPGAAQVGQHPVEIRVDDGAGGTTSQGWLLEVLVSAPNRPPVITSLPPFQVDVNTTYTYPVLATDPDLDVVQYALVNPPAGMSIDPTSGVLTWMPTTLGTYVVAITATDPSGAYGSQVYNLAVRPPNNPPSIASMPPLVASVGGLYQYAVQGTDPDGDVLAYSLLSGPAGLGIDPLSGVVSWTPTATDVGQHPVTVQADDQRGGVVPQSWTIDVIADSQAPLVSIVVNPGAPVVGQTVQICVQAGDDVGIVNRTLTIDGNPALLDSLWCAYTVPAQAGMITLAATAEDPAGNVGTTMMTVQVFDTPPAAAAVTIISPAPGEVIAGPTDVVATISTTDANPPPVTWEVRMRNQRTDGVTTVASGAGYVTAATLATVDPTLLCNDPYLLEVVVDNLAVTSTQPLPVSVEGDFKLGNFTTEVVDLAMPLAGIPITLSRAYDSLDLSPGDFGHGWRLNLPGQIWDSAGPNPFSAFTQGTKVYVTRTDGTRVAFTFAPEPLTLPFVGVTLGWNVKFTADEADGDELELVGAPFLFLSGGVFFDFATPFRPTLYRFKTREGLVFVIDRLQGLQSIEDIYGNVITVDATGLHSTLGPSITFERDAMGRITRIIEPADPASADPPGEIEYVYDGNDDLVSVFDQSDNEVKYLYEEPTQPHYLTRMEDPLGRPFLRNVFDAQGRLLGQCGPDGDVGTLNGCWTYNLDPMAQTQTLFDGEGNRLDLVLDARGNTLIERRYKPDNSVVEWIRTYEPGTSRMTSELDPAGNLTTIEYDPDGRLRKLILPGNVVWEFAFNENGDVTQEIDPKGNVTNYSYDPNGDLRFITDAFGGVTELQYDTFGQRTRYIDPAGQQWSYTYGPDGYPETTTDPKGRVMTTHYTAIGELEYAIDRKGQRIDFEYDASHRVTRETWSTTPATVIDYQYNAVGQVSMAASPAATSILEYWNNGLLKRITTMPAGGPAYDVTYGYDGPGGLVPGYDGNGAVTHVRDSAGALTRYVYDTLGRRIACEQMPLAGNMMVSEKAFDISYDDGGAVTGLMRYNDLARTMPVISTSIMTGTPAGPMTLGMIVHNRVSDGARLGMRMLVRDAMGFIQQVDDLAGTHTYQHDGLGRLIAATHPMGTSLPAESYAYDAFGNRQSSHLSATYDYGYEVSPGGHELQADQAFTYVYDDNGSLIQRTDPVTGESLVFDYDFRDRLVRVRKLDGAAMLVAERTYVYDALGRRIGEGDGVQTTWVGFDGMNPIFWLDASGMPVRRAFYGREPDSVIAVQEMRGTRWLLGDEVRTIRAVTDEAGNVLQQWEYDSFGRITGALNPGATTVGPFRFNARPYDEVTGLGYFRARYYDPALGRFLSQDTELPRGYHFGFDSPLQTVDPAGRSPLVEYACLALWAVGRAKVIAARVEASAAVLEAVAEVLASATPDNIQGAMDAADQLIDKVTCYNLCEIKKLVSLPSCGGGSWATLIVKQIKSKAECAALGLVKVCFRPGGRRPKVGFCLNW